MTWHMRLIYKPRSSCNHLPHSFFSKKHRSADIVMMTEKLYRLPQCIRLCRYARRVERLNIAIPCSLKLLQACVATQLLMAMMYPTFLSHEQMPQGQIKRQQESVTAFAGSFTTGIKHAQNTNHWGNGGGPQTLDRSLGWFGHLAVGLAAWGVHPISQFLGERRRRRLPDGHQNPKVQTPIQAIRAVRVIFATADPAGFKA